MFVFQCSIFFSFFKKKFFFKNMLKFFDANNLKPDLTQLKLSEFQKLFNLKAFSRMRSILKKFFNATSNSIQKFLSANRHPLSTFLPQKIASAGLNTHHHSTYILQT